MAMQVRYDRAVTCERNTGSDCALFAMAPLTQSAWQDGDLPSKLHLDSINQVLEPLTFKINIPPIAADRDRAAELAGAKCLSLINA